MDWFYTIQYNMVYSNTILNIATRRKIATITLTFTIIQTEEIDDPSFESYLGRAIFHNHQMRVV